MEANVRVVNEGTVVKDASVELRVADEVWVDISQMVSGIRWAVRVGEVSRIGLELLPGAVDIRGILGEDTILSLAEFLRQQGWTVERETNGSEPFGYQPPPLTPVEILPNPGKPR